INGDALFPVDDARKIRPGPVFCLRSGAHVLKYAPLRCSPKTAAATGLCVRLAGLVELGGHFYFSTRAPKVEDWVRSKASVGSLRRDGDLIVVAPDWAEPNARLAYGDAWFPLA